MADVTLPSLGESVTEGIITQWFKRIGDVVARDEPLFEVSTDKVDSEMPSPAAGVLTQILAGEGDTVETGARVAVIDESADAIAEAVAHPVAPESVVKSTPVATTPAPVAGPNIAPGRISSPMIRRLLNRGEVVPSTVVGTGVGGVITRRDAEAAVALGPTEHVVVALSSGRRRMGQHLVASAMMIPHGFVAVEVDAKALTDVNATTRTGTGALLVTNEAIVTWAAVQAMAKFPELNATWVDETLTLQRTVNVGVVRHGSPEGLVVPVVHAAARLSISALMQRLLELDEHLNQRQLSADDLIGGTFSVVAAPTTSTLVSMPIISAPQVAALSWGAPRQVPVIEYRDATPQVGVGSRMVLGLSFDYRVCDVALAVAYLERIGEVLADVTMSDF